MNQSEMYSKICEMEMTYGEDFYDLGGGSIGLSDIVDNLKCLSFLKKTKPAIYKHICEASFDIIGKDVDKMVEAGDIKLNIYDHDYFFVFNKDIKDRAIYEELKEFTDDNTSYECDDGELWKMVIVILAKEFSEIEEFLKEKFEDLLF